MAELAPKELIASLRRPNLLFTDAYLNDPILTKTQVRFIPETVLGQLNEIVIAKRDGGNFSIVDTGPVDPGYYPIEMFCSVIKRDAFEKYIDTTFREF